MATPKGKYDLKADWERAVARYIETTGLDPRQKHTPTPSEVLALIEAKKPKDAKDVSRIERVKDVAGKTLDCVARLGEIAAQAAAMVWGPSTICMNAISFLIETGKSYRNIFSSLETLFSRVFEALERVELYMKHEDLIPEEVAKLAHEVLLKFLSICELSHRVLKKTNKLMMMLKVGAFEDDQGVGEELEALERLEVRESRMGIASNVVTSRVIQRNVEVGFLKTSQDLQGVKEALSEAERGKLDTTQMKLICDQLGKPTDAHRHDLRANLNSLVPGTGEWIHNNQALSTWMDATNSDNVAVALVAEQGYGKSFVFTKILHELQQRYPQGMEDAKRVSIAWLYIHHEAKRVHSGASASPTGPPSVDLILRTFAVEIAQNDPLYRKDLFASLRQSASTADDVHKLAKRLFLDHSKSAATFFLMIDGVDELNEEQTNFLVQSLQVILAAHNRLNIKILLSSRPSIMDKLTRSVPDRLSKIDVTTMNGPDLEKYVDARLESMEVFKNAGMQPLREEVSAGIAAAVEGDFVYADILLKQIAAKQRSAEIRLVLEDAQAGGKRSDAIRSEIKRCNDKLDIVSIRDLNILLLWVMHSGRDLTIQELRSVLRIYGQEPSLKFFKQLTDDFSTFFTVTPKKNIPNAAVTLASETISDYFASNARTQTKAIASMEDHVSEAEIRLVKNFLHAFCEPNLYAKLGFDGFLDGKVDIGEARITVPEAPDSHAEILVKCLQCINGKYQEGAEPLKAYVDARLEHHFFMMEDLSLADPVLKAEIGSQLVDFLMSSDNVDGFAYTHKPLWFKDSLVNEMSRFLEDGAVLRRLTEDQRAWVREHNSRSKPGVDLLDNLAEGMARKWLGAVKNAATAYQSFLLLAGYFNKIDHALHPEVERFPKPLDNIEEIPAETIFSMAAWATEKADEEMVATYAKFNIGVVLRHAKCHDEALEMLYEARLSLESKLYIDTHIAIIHYYKQDHEEAIMRLQPVVDALKDGVDVWGSGNVAGDRQRCLGMIGEIHQAANRIDDQDDICVQLLQEDLINRIAYFVYTMELAIHSKNEEIVTFLRSASQRPGKGSEANLLQELISTYPYLHVQHGYFFQAAQTVGALAPVKLQYEEALDRLRTLRNQTPEDEDVFLNHLLLKTNLAVHLHRFSDMADEKEQAEKTMREVLELDAAREVSSEKVRQLQWAQLLCFWGLADSLADRTDADQARWGESERSEAEQLAGCIRVLAKSLRETEGEESEMMNATYVRGTLGRALSKIGMREEARQHLRTNVEVALALLSDDDPTNDWQGYRHLGEALMHFGDLENSIAAWSLIGPTQKPTRTVFSSQRDQSRMVEESDSTMSTTGEASPAAVASDNTIPKRKISTTEPAKSVQPDARRARSGSKADGKAKLELSRTISGSQRPAHSGQQVKGPLLYQCDGRCGKIWTYSDDYYVCRDCRDVQFDEPCLRKLREGTLKQNVCSSEHRFMHVPPYDPEQKARLGDEKVMVGGTVLKITDWLDGIRRDWSLEKEPMAAAS